MTTSSEPTETLSRRNERIWPRCLALGVTIALSALSYFSPWLAKVDPGVIGQLSGLASGYIGFLGIWLVILFTGTQRAKIEEMKATTSFGHLVDDFVETLIVSFGYLGWLCLVSAYGPSPSLHWVIPPVVFGATVGGLVYSSSCVIRVLATLIALIKLDLETVAKQRARRNSA